MNVVKTNLWMHCQPHTIVIDGSINKHVMTGQVTLVAFFLFPCVKRVGNLAFRLLLPLWLSSFTNKHKQNWIVMAFKAIMLLWLVIMRLLSFITSYCLFKEQREWVRRGGGAVSHPGVGNIGGADRPLTDWQAAHKANSNSNVPFENTPRPIRLRVDPPFTARQPITGGF